LADLGDLRHFPGDIRLVRGLTLGRDFALALRSECYRPAANDSAQVPGAEAARLRNLPDRHRQEYLDSPSKHYDDILLCYPFIDRG